MMQQLSGQDASFLYFETPSTHMHIASVALYDQSTAPNQRVRFRDLADNVRKRLHLAKCLRRRLVEVPMQADHPYWLEDRNFDLEYHIHHIALPPPGDWAQLCKQTARLHSFPLDRAHPLWELTVISGLKDIDEAPDGAFAVFLKVHHAAIDGASGAALTEVIHDESPAPARLPLPDEPWAGEPAPTAPELMARAFGNNLVQPFRFAEVLSRTAPAMRRAAASLSGASLGARVSVPRTRFNGPVTAHRVFDGCSYPLAAMRTVKRSVPGATINDLVLAIIGGALRKYLQAKNELPDEPLLAMAPINVRTAAESGAEGNRVAAMIAMLGAHIADPLERLAAVRDSTAESKVLTDAIGARLMTDYSRFIPAQARFAGGPAVHQLRHGRLRPAAVQLRGHQRARPAAGPVHVRSAPAPHPRPRPAVRRHGPDIPGVQLRRRHHHLLHFVPKHAAGRRTLGRSSRRVLSGT